ncbi:MAG: LytTR family DNA-binding domain-containing protein [Gammaproteobacteria bacterium]
MVGEAGNGLEALEMTRQVEPDALIIDIQMPGLTGLEAANHISKLSNPPAILFCTAYNEYAVEAFNVKAIAYLLKPVKLEKLENALEDCKRLTKPQLELLSTDLGKLSNEPNQKRSHISARTHRGIELIPVIDIRYFKADHKYVVIRHSRGEVLVDEALKDYEADFSDSFIRIHRNALVAIKYIEGLELVTAGHYHIRLSGIEERLPVSRRHAAHVRKLLASL